MGVVYQGSRSFVQNIIALCFTRREVALEGRREILYNGLYCCVCLLASFFSGL